MTFDYAKSIYRKFKATHYNGEDTTQCIAALTRCFAELVQASPNQVALMKPILLKSIKARPKGIDMALIYCMGVPVDDVVVSILTYKQYYSYLEANSWSLIQFSLASNKLHSYFKHEKGLSDLEIERAFESL